MTPYTDHGEHRLVEVEGGLYLLRGEVPRRPEDLDLCAVLVVDQGGRVAECAACEARRARIEKPVADLITPTPVDEPEGAWAVLQWLVERSDPEQTGGPDIYVPGPVRTALMVAIDDGDELADALKKAREVSLQFSNKAADLAGLLRRARRVLPDAHGMVPLRCAIDEALRNT